MEQQPTELQLIWDGKATLGEGPVWDHRTGQIIWVDIIGESIHMFKPADATNSDDSIGSKGRSGCAEKARWDGTCDRTRISSS